MKVCDRHYLKPDDINWLDYDFVGKASIHILPDVDVWVASIKFDEAFFVANEVVEKLLERIE